MRDLYNQISIKQAIVPATYSADNTPVAVDRQGFESVALSIDIGVGGITFTGTNKVEFVVTHSEDNSTYTNVTDADLLGVSGISNGIVKSLVAAHASADNTKIGYVGNKRYLKVLADFSGTHATGTPLGVNVILGNPMVAPAA